MVLTASSLIHYLLDRGLARAETVVDGDFRASDLSRRNQAFQVTFRTRPGYVVKQVGDWSPPNVRTFEAEAHWYWLARNHPGFDSMRRFLSTCSAYDAANQILILEVPEKCEDLDRYHRHIGRFPVETAQLLGETLAAFHTALPESVRQELRADFREKAPWVLSWHQASTEGLDSGKGAVELLEIVKGDPLFGKGFEELREAWRRETLINGDMKFAHCIRNGAALCFIDWEMADFGDPYWDVGGIFQEYLSAWLRSMPSAPGMSLADMVRQARRPLEQIQPAIRAFWQGYQDGGAGIQPAAVLHRATGYAAAWLIQSACQSLKDAGRITARAVRMAQLSRNILADPGAAARGLLGC